VIIKLFKIQEESIYGRLLVIPIQFSFLDLFFFFGYFRKNRTDFRKILHFFQSKFRNLEYLDRAEEGWVINFGESSLFFQKQTFLQKINWIKSNSQVKKSKKFFGFSELLNHSRF